MMFDKVIVKTSRCEKCEHKRLVRAQDGWEFYGCFCLPYKGKWIAQIKECPLKERGGADK